MIIGLFELIETTNQTLPNNITTFFFINMDWKKYLLHMWKMKGQI